MNKKHLGASLETAVKKWEKKDPGLRVKIDKYKETIERKDAEARIKAKGEYLDRISFLASVAHEQYEVIESLRREISMRDILLQMVL